MAEDFRVNPALIWLGDPTSGGSMSFMGKTRGDVTVEPNIEIATAQVDQQGMTPTSKGVWFSGLAPVATVPFVDEEKAKMNAYMKGGSIITANSKDALAFGSGISKIAQSNLDTLFIQPLNEIDQGTNGIDAPHGIWMPAVIANSVGQLMFNRPEGDDTLNPHEVAFAGLHRDTDQSGTDIPDDAEVMFQGSPDALGLTWDIPDPTAYI